MSASELDPSRVHTNGSTNKRVHVNFASKTYEMLQRIAQRKNGNMSEALRQSIALADYIESAAESGARILIDRGGSVTELLIR
jgi:hypothetical protein